MKSSIVICTKNRPYEIRVCLRSIAAQTVPAYELVIVDSSDIPLESQTSFHEVFNATLFAHTRLIYCHTKQSGTAYQRNRGIEQATGDLIYFVDDDAVYEPAYLEKMNGVFARYPEYGGGMGTLADIPPKRNDIYRLLRILFLLQRDHSSGTFTCSGMPTHPYGTTAFKRVTVLGGCCAYRRALVQQYMFDENLGVYAAMEDCDLSKRISDTYPLFFYPDAVIHHVPSVHNRRSVIEVRAIWLRNYSYLFFKNFYPRNRLTILCYWWSVLGLFVEALLMRNAAYLRGYIEGLCRFYRRG